MLNTEVSHFSRPCWKFITGRSHYPDEPWKRKVIAFVYQGQDAVRKSADIAGPTNPLWPATKNPGASAPWDPSSCQDAEGNVIGETDGQFDPRLSDRS